MAKNIFKHSFVRCLKKRICLEKVVPAQFCSFLQANDITVSFQALS